MFRAPVVKLTSNIITYRSFVTKPCLITSTVKTAAQPKAVPVLFTQNRNGFRTSATKQALPPIFLIILKAIPPLFTILVKPMLRPLLNIAAVIGGRNFRNWWRSLPNDKKYHYWSRIKEKKWKFAGAGVVTGSLAYYYYITHLEETPITGRKRFTIISNKKIEKLSEIEFEQVVKKNVGSIVHPDHPHYQRVTTVAKRLLDANKDLPKIQTKNWTVTVINSPEFNAAVLPNGNILVLTGLLKICSSDDELGVILGHEIAHSLLEHGRESFSDEHVFGAVKVLFTGLLWAFLPTDLIGLITYTLGFESLDVIFDYPYSRMLENEADQVGLQLAAKACFDVRSAVALWHKMSLLQADQPLEWFATHPSHTTRQKELEKQLPSVIRIREQCDCPKLPSVDPRQEMKELEEAVAKARAKQSQQIIPVAVELKMSYSHAVTSAKKT